MPWNKRTLAVPAIPPSVRLARTWVRDVLLEVGRPELVDSASLGVSELVTNALLHADPPVTIRVRGTVDHPRVEVTDQSLDPPHRTATTSDGNYLATFGRGLDLVASHSEKWGSDINFHGTGKTVWFEPAAEPRDAAEVPAIVFSPDEAVQEPTEPPELITVRLLGMPPALFARLRQHLYELARETRLLSLSEPDRHPDAAAVAEVFLQVEKDRRSALGVERLDEAMALGAETIDLDYRVPVTAPATMALAGELLERLYVTSSDRLLLATRPSPELLDLQRWYLDQFVRQGRGEPPTRWEGPTAPLDDA